MSFSTWMEKRRIDSFGNYVNGNHSWGAPTNCTHTMKSAPYGSFYVLTPDYWVFLTKYCTALASGRTLDLVERLSMMAPILVDLDITYSRLGGLLRPDIPRDPDDASPARVFDSADLLHALVMAFRRAIDTMSGADTSRKGDTSRAVVMVRAHARQLANGEFKDGVHIVFPEAVVAWPGHVRARSLALQDADLQTAFAEANSQHAFSQSLDQAVDDAFAKKTPNLWQMYGSSAPDNPAGPYLVSHVVFPRRPGDAGAATEWVPCGELDGCGRNVHGARDWEFWSRELSVMWPQYNPMSVCAAEEAIMSTMEEDMAERERHAMAESAATSFGSQSGGRAGNSDVNSSNVDDVRLAGALVKFFCADRADGYKSWIAVALALRGIATDLLPAFHDFSRMCTDKYDAEACNRIWLSLSKRPSQNKIGVGSLVMWARLDCKDDPVKLACVDRAVKERACSVRAPRTSSEPCRLSIEALAPPPIDYLVLARQLVNATVAFLAGHCGLEFHCDPGTNCVVAGCSAELFSSSDESRVGVSRACVVLDLCVGGGQKELRALVAEMVSFVTYNRAAFPDLFAHNAAARGSVAWHQSGVGQCVICAPTSSPASTLERTTMATIPFSARGNGTFTASEPAASALTKLSEKTSVPDLPRVDFYRARGCSVLSRPLRTRASSPREMDTREVCALRARLDAWPATADNMSDGTGVVSACEDVDGSVRALCRAGKPCPYREYRDDQAHASSLLQHCSGGQRCGMVLDINALRTSALVSCSCEAYDAGIETMGKVVLDAGRVPNAFTQDCAETHEITLHAQRECIGWSELYDSPGMWPYPSADKARLVCVVANMGVGKTKGVAQHLLELPAASTVVVVSANVTLCRYLAVDLPGVTNYQHCPKGTITPGKVVVCINSILRIPPTTCADILIIDEAVMVMCAIASELMAKFAHEALYRLLALAINAKQVLILDAFLDTTEARVLVDTMARTMGQQPYWIRNKHVRKGESDKQRHVSVFHTGELDADSACADSACADMRVSNVDLRNAQRAAAIEQATERVRADKKVVFLSNTRAVVDACHEALLRENNELRIAKYTATEAPRDCTGGPVSPDAWKDYDVLMYSPTVVAGISFAELHFDCLVAHFESGRNQPSVLTCLQMLGRVRRLIDDRMFVYVCARQTLPEYMPLTWSAVEKWLDSNLAHETTTFCAADVHFMPMPTAPSLQPYASVGRYDKESPSYHFILSLILSENLSARNFAHLMLKHFRDTQCAVDVHRTGVQNSSGKREQPDEEDVADALGVPFEEIQCLDKERYVALRDMLGPAAHTKQELASIQMYTLVNAYGVAGCSSWSVTGVDGVRTPMMEAGYKRAESFYNMCVAVKRPWAVRSGLERLITAMTLNVPTKTLALVSARLRAMGATHGLDANFRKASGREFKYGNLLVHGHALLHAIWPQMTLTSILDELQEDALPLHEDVIKGRVKEYREGLPDDKQRKLLDSLMQISRKKGGGVDGDLESEDEADKALLSGARTLLRNAFGPKVMFRRGSTNNKTEEYQMLKIDLEQVMCVYRNFSPTLPKRWISNT